MVEFTLQSCDQGYGGSPKIRGNLATTTMRRGLFSVDKTGTYIKSPTWVEASILRDIDTQKIDSLLRLGAVTCANLDKASQDAEVRDSTDGRTRRWHVQSNVNSSPEVRRHEVLWKSEDTFNDEEESDAKVQGRGIGRGFINTLSSGDRIGVVARARVCFNIIFPTYIAFLIGLPVIFMAESCIWRPD